MQHPRKVEPKWRVFYIAFVIVLVVSFLGFVGLNVYDIWTSEDDITSHMSRDFGRLPDFSFSAFPIDKNVKVTYCATVLTNADTFIVHDSRKDNEDGYADANGTVWVEPGLTPSGNGKTSIPSLIFHTSSLTLPSGPDMKVKKLGIGVYYKHTAKNNTKRYRTAQGLQLRAIDITDNTSLSLGFLAPGPFTPREGQRVYVIDLAKKLKTWFMTGQTHIQDLYTKRKEYFEAEGFQYHYDIKYNFGNKVCSQKRIEKGTWGKERVWFFKSPVPAASNRNWSFDVDPDGCDLCANNSGMKLAMARIKFKHNTVQVTQATGKFYNIAKFLTRLGGLVSILGVTSAMCWVQKHHDHPVVQICEELTFITERMKLQDSDLDSDGLDSGAS